jgi:hypothetical protein
VIHGYFFYLLSWAHSLHFDARANNAFFKVFVLRVYDPHLLSVATLFLPLVATLNFQASVDHPILHSDVIANLMF